MASERCPGRGVFASCLLEEEGVFLFFAPYCVTIALQPWWCVELWPLSTFSCGQKAMAPAKSCRCHVLGRVSFLWRSNHCPARPRDALRSYLVRPRA